jgi:hypothetical protein
MALSRETRLIVGCKVVKEIGWLSIQEFVDRLPQASYYCTDRAAVYEEMMWPEGSTHVISHKKEQTHNIESLNADLRTYLARLKRRSRCFSRSWQALTRAIRLFVWHYNARRRLILSNPKFRHVLPLLF